MSVEQTLDDVIILILKHVDID